VPSVVVRREGGDVIGYCGLVVGRATIDEPELAFELFRMAHGNGYATGAAAAVVAAAADTGRRSALLQLLGEHHKDATGAADVGELVDVLIRRHAAKRTVSVPRGYLKGFVDVVD
jgi:hypothetical protein